MLLFDNATQSGKSVKHTATGSVCFSCDLKNQEMKDQVSILVEQESGSGPVLAWTFKRDGFQWLGLATGSKLPGRLLE